WHPVDFITKEIEQKVGAEMSGGGLTGFAVSLVDKVNAPNVGQPGDGGSMMNEFEQLAGGGGGMMSELEKFL
ncbi:unnamed protein product, partial [Didymodactylos carnosus]